MRMVEEGTAYQSGPDSPERLYAGFIGGLLIMYQADGFMREEMQFIRDRRYRPHDAVRATG